MPAKLYTYRCTKYTHKGSCDRTVTATNPDAACKKAFKTSAGKRWVPSVYNPDDDSLPYALVSNLDNAPEVQFKFRLQDTH